jgi:hypothetical protein
MAQGRFIAVLLGSLMLTSPAVAQRADLSNADRAPGDRTTLLSSTEWALQANDSDLAEPIDAGIDDPRFSVTVRYAPPRQADSITTARGEVSWNIDDDNVLFGRVENLARDDLRERRAPVSERAIRVKKFQAGYARNVPLAEDLKLTVGGSAAAFDKPEVLDGSYGDSKLGYTVFARISVKK